MHNVLILNPPFLIKHHLTLKWKFDSKALWVLSFMFIALLLIFYIFQVNEMTKLSYLVENYEEKIVALSYENKNLEMIFSQTNSLESIEALVKSLNFEPVGKIHYIRILEDTIVTK